MCSSDLYNVPGGRVDVTTGSYAGGVRLSVTNTGPMIGAGQVERLFEPFQRLEGRTAHDDGHGLGLSIVRAIAVAHGAVVSAQPGSDGGHEVTVDFPATTVV